MVRVTNAHDVVMGEVKYYEFAGLSTDTKQTEGVATGSLFLEVDTGNWYAFDEAGSEWNQIAGDA